MTITFILSIVRLHGDSMYCVCVSEAQTVEEFMENEPFSFGVAGSTPPMPRSCVEVAERMARHCTLIFKHSTAVRRMHQMYNCVMRRHDDRPRIIVYDDLY